MLETSNEFMGVHADLRGSEISKASTLSKGNTVTVVCEGNGLIVGSPMLKDCVIQPNQQQELGAANQQVQGSNLSTDRSEAPQESTPVPAENSNPSAAQPEVPQEPEPVPVENHSSPAQLTTIAEINQQATALWNQKRYSDAFHLFNQACIGGEANSCYYLGLMYDFGQGLPRDSSRAAALYSKSCNSGNGAACYHLGMLRDYKPGSAACNSPAFIPNASRGCDSGVAMSCTMLGYSYSYGCGVAQDTERGRQFLGKACSLGYERACDSIK
jgi:TPR repeat protein